MPSARTGCSRVESLEPLILMSAASCEPTEGNDVLFAVGDDVDALDGNDIVFGLKGGGVLQGGAGHDALFALRGDNIVDGGDGNDVLYFWGILRDDVDVLQTADGRLKITTPKATAYVSNVETFQFKDARLTADELLPGPEYRSIDGTGNNPLDGELGSTNQQLIRLTNPEYSDGVSAPAGDDRPSARVVSNQLASQETTVANDRNLTDMTWLWGQFLDHDISISEGATPVEPLNIQVPSGDTEFDPFNSGDVEIGLNRTVYDPVTGTSDDNPRQQINQITSFIDGSMVYGSDEVRQAELRSYEDGRLRVSPGDLLMYNDNGLPNQTGGLAVDQQFLAGDVRANENIALSAMHTLWVREHNRIADELVAADASLTDEQVYQQARSLVTAEIQAITYNEFLPALFGADVIGDYTGYDRNVDPSMTIEFSTAAYRFGHTMLSSELLRLNNDGSVIDAGNIALLDAFFSPDEIVDHGIDSLLLGVTQQVANEVDTMIVDDVRNFLFGPPGAGGMDLAALNIQRGRDHGLADYNDVRVAAGLYAVTDFADITSDVELQQRLKHVYGTVDNIDLWVGGLAEDHVAGSSMGETFQAIIADQFARLRDGDRFWYENIFTGEQLQLIESTTLADVIERNTTVQGLQDDVFFL
jgi:peroxidase